MLSFFWAFHSWWNCTPVFNRLVTPKRFFLEEAIWGVTGSEGITYFFQVTTRCGWKIDPKILILSWFVTIPMPRWSRNPTIWSNGLNGLRWFSSWALGTSPSTCPWLPALQPSQLETVWCLSPQMSLPPVHRCWRKLDVSGVFFCFENGDSVTQMGMGQYL